MKFPLKSILLALTLFGTVACTANATPETVSPAAVKKTFEAKFPNRAVVSVRPAPVSGLYEVVVKGRQIVYVDAKVNYLFVGDLIDTAKRESLTEQRMVELSRVDWKTLPLELAFKEVRGNGERKLAVFTDPDCPFCKKLEQESLTGVTNVTIYTFLYPIAELHPDATRKSRQVWCASDRAATWAGFMRDGKPLPEVADCDAPIEKIRQLGEKLGITGTPALIFANGELVPGAIPRDRLESLLNAR